MALLKQAALKYSREPLQIAYPSDYVGEKSIPNEDEIFISTQPRMLTIDEIELIENFLTKLPYTQSLYFTGLVLIDPGDSLLKASHDDLDLVEKNAQLSNTRLAPGGGTRSVMERVLLIREAGYYGNGKIAITA